MGVAALLDSLFHKLGSLFRAKNPFTFSPNTCNTTSHIWPTYTVLSSIPPLSHLRMECVYLTLRVTASNGGCQGQEREVTRHDWQDYCHASRLTRLLSLVIYSDHAACSMLRWYPVNQNNCIFTYYLLGRIVIESNIRTNHVVQPNWVRGNQIAVTVSSSPYLVHMNIYSATHHVYGSQISPSFISTRRPVVISRAMDSLTSSLQILFICWRST